MSQYTRPIDLEGGGNTVPINRGIPLLGPVQQPDLLAPGLAVQPINTSGVEKLGRLQQALGLVGDVAGRIGYDAERRAARIDQQTDETERLLKHNQQAIEIADRGQAALDARRELPQLRSDILSGKIKPAGDVNEYINSHIANRTSVNTPAYREEFQKITAPEMNQAFTAYGDKLQAQFENTSFQHFAASAAEEPTATRKMLIVAAAQKAFPHLSHEEIVAKTLYPAAQAEAARGDTKALEASLRVIGDHATPLEREQLLSAAATQQSKARAATDQAFHDVAAGLDIDGAPESLQRQRIMEFRGHASDNAIQAELHQLDERMAQKAIGLRAKQKVQYKDAITQEALTEFVADSPAAHLLASTGIHTTYPDGTELNVTDKELTEMARASAFDRIAAVRKGDPAGEQADQLRWLQNFPTATDPLRQSIYAGISRMGTAETSGASFPARAEQAIALYEQESALAPGVTDAQLTAPDREFLRMVTAIRQRHQGMTRADAATIAWRAAANNQTLQSVKDKDFDTKIVNKALNDTSIDGMTGDEINRGGAIDEIKTRAAIYKMAFDFDEPTAIKQATADFEKDWTVVNGMWTNRAGRPVVDKVKEENGGVGVNTLSKFAVEDYLSSTDKEDTAGYEPDDLALVPVPGGAWTVVEKSRNIPVPRAPVYSDADMMRLNSAIIDDQKYEAAVARAQELTAKRVRFGTPSTFDILTQGSTSDSILNSNPTEAEKRRSAAGRSYHPPFTANDLAETFAAPPKPGSSDLPDVFRRIAALAKAARLKKADPNANVKAVEKQVYGAIPDIAGGL